MKTNVIHIEITGPVQTGKSTIAASIKELLTAHGYCVAMPDRAERNNPSKTLDKAAQHEKPHRDMTVIVISEHMPQ